MEALIPQSRKRQQSSPINIEGTDTKRTRIDSCVTHKHLNQSTRRNYGNNDKIAGHKRKYNCKDRKNIGDNHQNEVAIKERDDSYRHSLKILSEHELNDIAKFEDTKVVDEISRKLKGFQELLDTNDQMKKNHVMKNVLTIMAKTTAIVEKSKHSKCGTELQFANRIIGEALSPRHSKFQLQLKVYIDSIELSEMMEVCRLFCQLLNFFPSIAWDSLPISELGEALKRSSLCNESCFKQIEEMNGHYEKAKKKPALKESFTQMSDNSEYKEIPIIPRWNEVLCSKSLTRKRLRPNITTGNYEDWLHYFDIHFRLLREDFVAPLRSGVHGYLNGTQGKKLKNIKVYTNVSLDSIKCSKSGVCYQIKIRSPPRSSKRLMYGSLVCLSCDDFKDNILFGIVDNRDGLNRGFLDVKFCDDASSKNMLHYVRTRLFVLVESCVYFEPFRPIFLSLQRSEASSMPFTKYLIESNCTIVKKPQYLSENPDALYDLSHLQSKVREDDKKIDKVERFSKAKDVREDSLWQTDDMNLDQSQIKALKNALTQELSLIQGPPGTGKTYIGLKLIETLLNNKKIWNSTHFMSPILVVCYTNHALDQFLEGILDCEVYKNAKEPINLLRAGTRMKSKRLEDFTIHKKCRMIHVPEPIIAEKRKASRRQRESRFAIQDQWDKLKLSLETIVPIQHLEYYLNSNHRNFFFHGNYERSFLYWLLPLNVVIPSTANFHFSTNPSNEQPHLPCPNNNNPLINSNDLFQLDEEHQEIYIEDYEGFEKDDDGFLGIHGEKDKEKEFESIIPVIVEQQNNIGFSTRERIKKLMIHLYTVSPMSEDRVERLGKLHTLSWSEKFELYKYWVVKYQKYLMRKCSESFYEYNSACKELLQVKEKIDRLAMETASVIGMTTTCAARYQEILQYVKPKIIIVEEAAEVPESHIVSALSNGTQHLVLIGDHKQLRPKPNDYELEKKYNLGISLFERLIRNGHPHVSLEIQHRMRPEIAQLVHPHIYDTLLNHSSVAEYPNIRGVSSNLFFIDHNEPESECACDNSHSNDHEAEFLVAFCRYLLQQDYGPDQITILVAYSGQLFKIKQKMEKVQESLMQKVRITTVDNFQGEENDIILLSLVRSNEENKIGFLNEENRVCVALSRARQGFYCIGNIQLLRQKSAIWDSIISDMETETKKKVGAKLILQCHNHPEITFEAYTSNDFEKNSPFGGCNRKCAVRLPCGHMCENPCHSSDPEHKAYLCTKKCNRFCKKGHPCERKCHQDCGPCRGKIKVTLPCGHKQTIYCSTDPYTIKCIAPCFKRCPEGHSCKKLCCEDCGDCDVSILKTMAKCNHRVHIPCYIQPLHQNCPKPCDKILSCGHKCALKCGQDCSSVQCIEKVKIKLPCSHNMDISCWRRDMKDIQCNKPCDKLLPCNHTCINLCREPCAVRCYRKVSKSYPCKHVQEDYCFCNSCELACEKKLNCGHPCFKLCGEPCQEQCTAFCGEILICGHKCKGTCHSCKSTGVHKVCDSQIHLKHSCGHQQTILCAGRTDQQYMMSHNCPERAGSLLSYATFSRQHIDSAEPRYGILPAGHDDRNNPRWCSEMPNRRRQRQHREQHRVHPYKKYVTVSSSNHHSQEIVHQSGGKHSVFDRLGKSKSACNFHMITEQSFHSGPYYSEKMDPQRKKSTKGELEEGEIEDE